MLLMGTYWRGDKKIKERARAKVGKWEEEVMGKPGAHETFGSRETGRRREVK